MAESFSPRKYQNEIFEKAMEGNVIAWMDTGSGKTFIAVMLIRWMSAQTYSTGRKVVVFLAPNVALVQQQATVISEQTSLTVRGYSGMQSDSSGKRIDTWDMSKWRTQFEQTDVLVMTPALFVNILSHAYWRLEQVSLLVFDEVHHCQKDHMYNQIMRDFYRHESPHLRPKIFGMTASPIWNPKQRDRCLEILQSNTDSRIHRVKKHSTELGTHSYHPNEVAVYYPSSPPHPYINNTLSLWDSLDGRGLLQNDIFNYNTLHLRYEAVLLALGLYTADAYLYSYMTDQIKHVKQTQSLKQRQSLYFASNVEALQKQSTIEEYSGSHEVLDAIDTILQSYSQYFSLPGDIVHISWFSAKFQKLVSILTERRSSQFQGIVFVSQRHVAAILCDMIARMPELSDWLYPSAMMGHGDSETDGFAKGMMIREQNRVRQKFLSGEVNLLVATSVAEEGLDFPACELIIRFDGLHHMIGYLQSRGRARRPDSTYVVMIADDSEAEKKRYQDFTNAEELVKGHYDVNSGQSPNQMVDDEPDTPDNRDLNDRETYLVPSTGARVTFDSSIPLLAHYCSLIPHDHFSPVYQPTYEVYLEGVLYKAKITLPSVLPLDPEDLSYISEGKHTKKEAKRAAAYEVVLDLHRRFRIFDDHLLPISSTTGNFVQDADGRPIPNTANVPSMIDTNVVDPWHLSNEMWLHPIIVDGVPVAGLVTSVKLPEVSMTNYQSSVSIGHPCPLTFSSPQYYSESCRIMAKFTECCLAWIVTSRRLQGELTCYVVPLLCGSLTPDYNLMADIIPKEGKSNWSIGREDWPHISPMHYGKLLMQSRLSYGRPLILVSISDSLTTASLVQEEQEGSSPDRSITYFDYFQSKFGSNLRGGLRFVENDRLLKMGLFTKPINTKYSLDTITTISDTASDQQYFLLPQSLCQWIPIPYPMFQVYSSLAPLMQRVTDVYRAQLLCQSLGIRQISVSTMVEALTLPSSNAGFSNQRLETLGDAVLKLSVVTHVYNKYPRYHEGQLSALKTSSISNRLLLCRGLEAGLLRYMTVEPHHVRTWRFTSADSEVLEHVGASVKRRIPRRSIQDCMEALLGVAFCNGGINLSLSMGTRLGLCFGGDEPWIQRYEGLCPCPAAVLFQPLEVALGYQFRCSDVLREALTHPSIDTAGISSYQRLEFLGDALIDMVIMETLFIRFPQATSGQLSWARSRAVCNPSLAMIAVRELSLHKFLLYSNSDLGIALIQYVAILNTCSYDDMVLRGWKYDPPKVLSDITESLFGAMFVDSGYDYTLCKAVILRIFDPLICRLSPTLPLDPVSELLIWVFKAGCRQVTFKKLASDPYSQQMDGVTIVVHGIELFSPVQGMNLSFAKYVASEKARIILDTPEDVLSLSKLCICKADKIVGHNPTPDKGDPVWPQLLDTAQQDLNDETIEGFANKGQYLLEVINGGPSNLDDTESEELPEHL